MALVAAAVVLVGLVGIVAIYFVATKPCLDDPARICVPKAGISLVLPQGWSVTSADSGELLVAMPGSDAHVRIVIETGATVLGTERPTTLDEVEASVRYLVAKGGRGFSHINESAIDRVVLPIGPAVRLRYTSTTAFILAYQYASRTDWFFVNGQLIVLEYQTAFGEGTAYLPGPEDPSTLASIADSIRLLPTGAR